MRYTLHHYLMAINPQIVYALIFINKIELTPPYLCDKLIYDRTLICLMHMHLTCKTLNMYNEAKKACNNSPNYVINLRQIGLWITIP